MSLHNSDPADTLYAHFWFVLVGIVLMTIVGSAMALVAVVSYWAKVVINVLSGPPR